ncbi:MAG: 4Fe-4S ferredoxin N-terminal domain-containing protein, partial [Nitrospinota bacterium]
MSDRAESHPAPDAKPGLSRRALLKSTALVGGAALLADRIRRAHAALRQTAEKGTDYPLARAENQIHSVCLQCHTACPIKVKILDGVAVKIDGSPYGTQTLLPHLPTSTSPFRAAPVDGKICPKGQAGIQTLYDPYRLRKVLKRAGPRGSNRWETISFEQAVREIVEGGRTFRKVPGEEGREAPGLRSLFALRDAKLSKAMAADAKRVANGKMTVEAFQTKYAGRLDVLIDPAHPDLGPKNNQFVGLFGRIEHGRKEWANRWLINGFGSNNRFDHTTICEQSHHIAYKEATKQFKKGKWTGGKSHMKPDAWHSEFILFFGTGAFEANFGPTNMAEKVTEGLETGRLRIAVVDPRLSKTAAKAWRWVPIRPGGDAALALGMIRFIIGQGRYDAKFLENANRAAALADGETSWTGATHLVRLEADGSPGAFLRAEALGLGGKDRLLVSRGGELLAVDPNDKKNPVEGDLDVFGEARGIRYKSAFRI